MKELNLVANVVKHASGPSAGKLHVIRPDLFSPPGLEEFGPTFAPKPEDVEHPAGGLDLYVTEHNLQVYFKAAEEFWIQFCEMIQR